MEEFIQLAISRNFTSTNPLPTPDAPLPALPGSTARILRSCSGISCLIMASRLIQSELNYRYESLQLGGGEFRQFEILFSKVGFEKEEIIVKDVRIEAKRSSH